MLLLFQSTSDVGQAGKNLEKYFDKLFKENFSNTDKKSKVQRRRWTISFILLLSYIENNLRESNRVSVVYWIMTENTNWIKIRQSERDTVIKNRDRPQIWEFNTLRIVRKTQKIMELWNMEYRYIFFFIDLSFWVCVLLLNWIKLQEIQMFQTLRRFDVC